MIVNRVGKGRMGVWMQIGMDGGMVTNQSPSHRSLGHPASLF